MQNKWALKKDKLYGLDFDRSQILSDCAWETCGILVIGKGHKAGSQVFFFILAKEELSILLNNQVNFSRSKVLNLD